MKEVDLKELDQTIDEFAETVGSLAEIAAISERTTKVADRIDALCSTLESSTQQVLENTDSVKKSLSKFDSEFQASAEGLLSVRDTILSSNERVSEAVTALSQQQSEGGKSLAEKIAVEAETIRSYSDAANRRMETQLGIITDRLSLLQSLKSDIEVVKAQLSAEKKIAVAGTIAAVIAMVAAVAGLFF